MQSAQSLSSCLMTMGLLRRLHPLFPYFGHHQLTHSYAYRMALNLQRDVADQCRKGEIGHYYEFGVYLMRTMRRFEQTRRLYAIRDKRFRNIKFFGFDSFEGSPPLADGDTFQHQTAPGELPCSLEECKQQARKAGIKDPRFIKGFFDDVLTPELQRELAAYPPSIVNVDFDLYSSADTVLRWLDPIALPGAIYYFVAAWDLMGNPDAGVLRAIKEYNQDRGMRGSLTEHPIGMGSKMLYMFSPKDPNECIEFDVKRLPIRMQHPALGRELRPGSTLTRAPSRERSVQVAAG